MDKTILTLEKGTSCTSWSYSGHRLAAGLVDGSLVIYDSIDPASSTFHSVSRFKVSESSILKIVWIPPKYGDAVCCISADGTLSLWEEVVEDNEEQHWKACYYFGRNTSKVLDVQFGDDQTCLKLIAAYIDGQMKIYELVGKLELDKWQLQAEFQNAIDSVSKFGNSSCQSASIAWHPPRSEVQQSSFVVGFNSNTPPLNSPKVWEFDLDHQRWLPVAELSLPEDKGDQVFAVAWAPNIGRRKKLQDIAGLVSFRPYELIAVATQKGISIWHLNSNPDLEGRLSSSKVALLSSHGDEVLQMEWDMSGTTLATTGSSDGTVRLWQSDLNGMWREQAVLSLQSQPL